MNIPNTKETFSAKLDKNGPLPRQRSLGRCWMWKGKKNNDGYGTSSLESKFMLCHRIAFTLFKAPIKKGEQVLHRCDQPACCRPSHLFIGDHGINMQDMWDKNRHTRPIGEKNNHAKLTEVDVIEIRRKFKNREAKQVDMAKFYGVTQASISCAVRGATWSHIK